MIDIAKRWQALSLEIDDLESTLKAKKQALADAERELMEDMALNGVTQVQMDGYTIYVRSFRHVSLKSEFHDKAVQMLKELGMGAIVRETVNPQTFKATVSDLIIGAEDGNADAQKNLDQLSPYMNRYEGFALSQRRSGSSRSATNIKFTGGKKL